MTPSLPTYSLCVAKFSLDYVTDYTEEELIQGVKVARGCPRINHLLFADDTMFFLDANESNWSNKFLSSAGKLVMLQSVLSAILSYPMSSFKMPVSLCKRIRSIVTRFWWDNNESARKMVWVSWDLLAKPKPAGGLGLRDFQKFNDALLAKTGWRLLHNPNCLLGKVLKGNYFSDTNILLAAELSSMSHGWRSVLAGRDLLLKNLVWIVGDGLSIDIWQDPWLSLDDQERPMGHPTEQRLIFVFLIC